MTFLRHPQSIARETQNAEALRAAGLDPALAPQFDGSLVYKGDVGYNQDRQLSNPVFQDYPYLIAYCQTHSDVAWCLERAYTAGWPFVCRSGGHSTAGYSMINNGIVIDTSRLNSMSVLNFEGSNLGFFGPGVKFGELNKYLKPYNLHVPGGGCTDVRIGGYMQGGGYGFTSREFGMHCDNVFSINMMTWDGTQAKIVYADKYFINSDLWWAVCGGTGNNFGVLLQANYQLYTLPGIWGVWLQWSLDTTQEIFQAANALYLLQQEYMLSGAPSTFGYMVLITGQGPNNAPVLMVRATFDGTQAQLNQVLQTLMNTAGVYTPAGVTSPQYGDYADMNVALMETPYGIPQLPSANWGEDKQSGYIGRTLQVADWEGILNSFLTAFSGSNPQGYLCPYTTLVLEPMGGAINQKPTNYNAFVHRTAATDFFIDVFWELGGNQEAAAKGWLNDFMAMMGMNGQQYFNNECYQNYPRANLVGLPGYKQAYWHTNYYDLVMIKRKYDPTNFFTFPQAIDPNDTVTQGAESPIGKFLKEPIVYPANNAPSLPAKIK